MKLPVQNTDTSSTLLTKKSASFDMNIVDKALGHGWNVSFTKCNSAPGLLCCMNTSYRLLSWLNGNMLVSIDVFTLCQACLVSGCVTVLGWANHLRAKLDTQVYSA